MYSKIFSLLFALLIFSCQAHDDNDQITQTSSPLIDEEEQEEQEYPRAFVYFIGNSLTANNNIPGKFNTLMEEFDKYTESVTGYLQTTRGAFSLEDYIKNATFDDPSSSRIVDNSLANRPKYIVIQEQSSGVSVNRTRRVIETYKHISRMIGASLILYPTWGTAFNYGNERDSREFSNFANTYNINMIPIVDIWLEIESRYGRILTPDDDYHANNLGAIVNSVAFFYMLNPEIEEVIEGILSVAGNHNLTDEQARDINSIIFTHIKEEPLAVIENRNDGLELPQIVSELEYRTLSKGDRYDVLMDMVFNTDSYGYRQKGYSIYNVYNSHDLAGNITDGKLSIQTPRFFSNYAVLFDSEWNFINRDEISANEGYVHTFNIDPSKEYYALFINVFHTNTYEILIK